MPETTLKPDNEVLVSELSLPEDLSELSLPAREIVEPAKMVLRDRRLGEDTDLTRSESLNDPDSNERQRIILNRWGAHCAPEDAQIVVTFQQLGIRDEANFSLINYRPSRIDLSAVKPVERANEKSERYNVYPTLRVVNERDSKDFMDFKILGPGEIAQNAGVCTKLINLATNANLEPLFNDIPEGLGIR